ncbi:helix-turn-helix transcriptional regulator [Streptomyces sp. ISL-22]|uniref:helix-turn-helix domain-containing protein n=1 Tax=unclassified Streptomyces TaxID=2593676 RepID=UPI001BE90626|nr:MULTISPECIES: helix-turn-helix transcriptional regulator [unclassified Streptomyces]MBT2420804.1 helix-turn-helix transcriptional regulator [Streptomyces sp. ISL-24]MBT2431894.1 helix-turn-helix transcriptional regulator [Streptomyces sp. ISL-22]
MPEKQSEARRIGEVIRRARVLRRRSQKDVATALGYHQSKVSRLEHGRGTRDMAVLRALAQELGIPPGQLGLAAEAEASDARPGGRASAHLQRRTFLAAGLAALSPPPATSTTARDDLVQALLPGLSPSPTGASAEPAALRKRVGVVRRLFYTCDYTTLERVLPGLIADLRQAVGSPSADKYALSAMLATAYQTATSLLLKQHDQGNAWLAVGRAMAEAERSGDPVVLASSVRVQAHVLAREKHTVQAVTVVRHTADQLAGSYDRRSPQYLAALGLLLLRGVTAASGGGDRSACGAFLAEAKEVARHVCLDRPDAWANFSPTNVALHEVSALVVMGDTSRALQVARPLMRRPIPVPERRAALWVEAARAYSRQDRLADACRALQVAESCAAQDVRRPAVRDLVADMAARDGRRRLPQLHEFSRRLGAPA